MGNTEIFEAIEQELREGRPVVQATVIKTRGSTPRKEGSTMLVKADGKLVGTIGGGCGEAGVIQKARLSLLDGEFREELADLTEDISLESEAVCGGTLRVFIEPWQPDPEHIALAAALKTLSSGEQGVVVHQIVQAQGRPELLGRRVFTDAEGRPLASVPGGLPASPASGAPVSLPEVPRKQDYQLKAVGDYEVYTERWDPVPTVVIVGAGHIAEPLESISRQTGFRTIVVDDRTLFANRERFPQATQVVCGPILDVVRQIPLTPHTYVVLVTRGHVLDMDALKVMLEREEPVAYVGMIGSSRRIRAVFELLEQQGYAREAFGKVHAPVGLNIQAETPAEIAVSVVAEMINVRRHGDTDTRPLSAINRLHPAARRKTLAS